MRRLAVFLTEKELGEVKKLATSASKTPAIVLNGAGPDAASMAWKSVHEKIYGYALAHGLPEIPGYYGADLATGELLKT